MLNHEGWCLMLILCALITLLLIGLPHMRTEKTVEKRLAAEGNWLWTAAGTALRACGVLVLAVIPSSAYRGGVMRLGLPIFCSVGLAALLCVLLPRIRGRGAQAQTLCQAAAHDCWVRAGLGALCACGALVSAAAAVSMVARMFAYVFSLHYMIALGASVGLALVLTLLCGAQSRHAMDRLQIVLLTVLLIGTPAAALFVSENANEALQALALSGGHESADIWDVLCDLCAGLGAAGLLLPAQTLFSEHNPVVLRKSGIAASAGIAVLMLLAALAGFMACAAGIELTTVSAAETVLTQIAELSTLPHLVSGVLSAALLTTLLMYAQAALHFFGTTVAWDIVQPLTHGHTERPAALMAELISAAACVLTFVLAMYPNTPLEWYVRMVLLCGSVICSLLVLQVCGVKAGATGQRIGLAAGAAVILITLLLPIPEKWKILGALPAALLTALPQLAVKDKDKQEKSA